VNYLACMGLLVLLGFSPVLQNDPEQLFVEAMKLAETGARGDSNKQLDEACLLWTKRGETERAARARLQIGDLYRNDKRFQESLSQYHQVLLIQGVAPSLKALAYDSIGQVYAELYQTELSLHNYSKALDLARQNKDFAFEAHVQLNLASLSAKAGDFGRAMELAQSAVTASGKEKNRKELAAALGFLAQMELKNGRLEKGRNDLEQALSLSRENNDLPAQIKLLCLQSAMNLSAGQTALAKEQAQSALELAEDVARRTPNSQRWRTNPLRWPCWLALARAQRASQQREDARKSYFRALTGTVIDWWVVYASTERSAIGFAEDRQTAYRELIDLLVELGQIEEAYNAYQYARVRTLAGVIRARRFVGVRSATDSRTSALSASMNTLRTRLLSPALNKQQRDTLQRELAEVEANLAEKRLQAELNEPRRRMVFSQPPGLKQVQNQIPGDSELLLEFCLGEKRSFAWLISRGRVSFEELPGRAEIEGKVRQYVNDLSTPPSNLHLQSSLKRQRAMADELFRMLFGKLAKQLPADSKLIVIPDGLLNHVPFESLVQNDRYLIQSYQITYLPSASLIELLRQAPTASTMGREDQLDLLAFGDPVFQQRAKNSSGRKLPPTRSGTKQDAWDMTTLAPLPRSRDEVEYIASLIPKGRKRLYLGKDSTEKTFKQETLSKFKWIHLATHSFIDEQNPDRSAVVLALDADNNEDGFLRATEIADLALDCDLVILSACETGRGRLSSGEGVIGLSRSFFIAGTRSVVVSQWAVSDISTAQLMKDFYRQLVNNIAKPAALREAKLRMINGGSETRHPYYWAPFILIGTP
jgi:CHAT domain-containing protein